MAYDLPTIRAIEIDSFENEILNSVNSDDAEFLQRIYTKKESAGVYVLAEDISDDTQARLFYLLSDIGILIKMYTPDLPMRKLTAIDEITFCDLVGIWLRLYLTFQVGRGGLTREDADIIYAPAYPDIIQQDFDGKLNLLNLTSTISSSTPESPTQKVGAIITYKVVRHEPASLEGQPFTGRVPRKARITEEHYDEVNNRTITELILRWDNIIQFDCFAKTDAEAIAVLKNLENMLMVYGDEMGRWGLSVPPLHWGWVEDTELTKRLKSLKARSVQFYVRTEAKFIRDHNAIDQISIAVRMLTGI